MEMPGRRRDTGIGVLFSQTTNNKLTINYPTNNKNWIPELVRNDRKMKLEG
jgi:hypothetical protein